MNGKEAKEIYLEAIEKAEVLEEALNFIGRHILYDDTVNADLIIRTIDEAFTKWEKEK